jgi:hypothetical protein
MKTNLKILLESGLFLVISLLNVSGDGGCFFYCLVAFFLERMSNGHDCDEILLDSNAIRKHLCDKLIEFRDVTVHGLQMTPEEFFHYEYSLESINRQSLHNPFLLANVVALGLDPSQHKIFANSFEEYIAIMQHPNTHADNLIVAFFAQIFDVHVSVFTRSVTEVQPELTGDENVDKLISIGFRRDAIEQLLLETSGNIDQALNKILEKPSSQIVPSFSNDDIWREQPYNILSGLHINLINDGFHFQLILSLSQVHSCDATSQLANPKIRLPDILCLDEDSDSFDNTQISSSSCYITNPQDFFDACNSAILREELLEHVCVPVRFNKVYSEKFRENLFGSLMFVESNRVRYRVVSFTLENGFCVCYHGNIVNLSRSAEKLFFYSQLESKISCHDVISVTIKKL